MLPRLFAGLLLLGHTFGAPANNSSPSQDTSSTASVPSEQTRTSSFPPAQKTVPPATNDPNNIQWTVHSPDKHFDPIRGKLGASIIGPQNVDIERQNADLFIPPSSDIGSVKNAKWPFSLSHNRIQTGGWARQQNQEVMPIATEMAGVNMRLAAGAIRELHWHKTAEWAYVIKGQVQVTVIDADGHNYLANSDAGDLWYFPPGLPHSLQATDTDPDGAEFLLVFPDGAFSEDETFLITDWLGHIPKEVLAANFRTNISAFDHIPSQGLYIFPSAPPPVDAKAVSNPNGGPPEPFTFAMSKVKPTKVQGGQVKVVDSSTFKVSKEIAVAEVEVEPGAIRELHWHPTQDEWSFFLQGEARVTLFASEQNSRTFNYQAGDGMHMKFYDKILKAPLTPIFFYSYVPASFGHYVQNIGNTTLKYLEIFKSDRFQDISLNQWLALTPPALVKAHLGLDDETIKNLQKVKPIVVGPA